jgi:hypothetical protein
MAKSKKDSNVGAGLLGVGAVLAAAAGAYFLYGKDGAKNRKKVKGWMLKAKGEVLDKIEKAKDINEETYHQIIQSVAKRYEAIKTVDPAELAALIAELKAHWKNIKRHMEPAKPKSKAKKAAKKAPTKKAA